MTALRAPVGQRGGRDFVGRDRELAELVAGLEDGLGGHGRLFLIAGEPGIGKTRLAEQLASQAADRAARVNWGRCWEGGGAPPYWPWAQIIRGLAEECDDQSLRSWLGTGAAFIAQVVPDLAVRLEAFAQAPVPPLDSDAARFCLFEATTGFLKRAAATQPLLLILDDLHAADEPSLLLLRYLARDLRSARLVVVGTYRDVDGGRAPGIGDALGELVRDGQVTTLHGLTSDDVDGLIGNLTGCAPSAALVRAVHERTEGNPLFVREAVRLLAAAGPLDHLDRPSVPIPGSVRTLIQQRLAPLSADAVQALSAAAVVGRDFDLSLVVPACGLPAERVLQAVSEAIALGVVVEDAIGRGGYRFSHSLMREVLYEALPIPLRTALHRAVGEVIERLYGPDSDRHLAELARHFAEAGEGVRALTYTRRAGDRAMRAHAYEEAVAEYQRALHALEMVGPGLAGADAAEPMSTERGAQLRCELLLDLGAAQVRAGRYPEAKEVHLQAAEIARRIGSADKLARAALGFGEPQVEGGHVNRRLIDLLREALDALSDEDSPLRARLLARLSVELTFSDDVHLTDGLSRQAVEMARRLGDARSLGDALDARWMAVWGPDGLAERAALAGEILKLAQATGDRDLELLGRGQRIATSLESGDALAVEADIVAYGSLADELRMPVYQWAAATMRAMRLVLQGSFDEAERLAEEALAIQPGRPNAHWARNMELEQIRWEQGRLGELRDALRALVERFPRAAIARARLALADIERGDHESARQALPIIADLVVNRPRLGLWLQGVAVAALVAAHLDDAEVAERLYPVLLPYAQHIIAMSMEQPVVCLGSASLYLALLAATASRWDDAVEHFEAALKTHERLGAAPLLARTQAEYARMLLRRGQDADRPPALALLDRAATTAQRLGMPGLGAEIASLLEAHADAAAPAEAAPTGEQPATVASAPSEPERDRPGRDRPGRDRFQREGEFWTVAYDDRVVRLKDSKGLRQIAVLLGRPGQELLATDLEAMVGGPAEAPTSGPRGRADHGELELRSDFGDAGELLDAEAKAAYKARLDELQEEIDEADELNDSERAEQARTEREFLVRELARAVGIGGRDRKAASHAERARLNATRAIRAAMANLGREHPALGRHLAATIRTGRYCSYTPDPRTSVAWEL